MVTAVLMMQLTVNLVISGGHGDANGGDSDESYDV